MFDQPHVIIGSRCTFCGRNDLDVLTLGPQACDARDGSTVVYRTESGQEVTEPLTEALASLKPNTNYYVDRIITTVPPGRQQPYLREMHDQIDWTTTEVALPGWIFHIDDPESPEA